VDRDTLIRREEGNGREVCPQREWERRSTKLHEGRHVPGAPGSAGGGGAPTAGGDRARQPAGARPTQWRCGRRPYSTGNGCSQTRHYLSPIRWGSTSETTPINILIANEQAQEAKEATLRLRAFFPDSRIEVVYSADEVVQWAAKRAWHTILADADLFRQSGLATLTELKRQAPMATIIVQVDCNDMTLGMQVLRYGADFYMSKTAPAFLIELPLVVRTFVKIQDLNAQLQAANERVQCLEEQVARMQTERHALVEQLDQVRQQHTQWQEAEWKRLKERPTSYTLHQDTWELLSVIYVKPAAAVETRKVFIDLLRIQDAQDILFIKVPDGSRSLTATPAKTVRLLQT